MRIKTCDRSLFFPPLQITRGHISPWGTWNMIFRMFFRFLFKSNFTSAFNRSSNCCTKFEKLCRVLLIHFNRVVHSSLLLVLVPNYLFFFSFFPQSKVGNKSLFAGTNDLHTRFDGGLCTMFPLRWTSRDIEAHRDVGLRRKHRVSVCPCADITLFLYIVSALGHDIVKTHLLPHTAKPHVYIQGSCLSLTDFFHSFCSSWSHLFYTL